MSSSRRAPPRPYSRHAFIERLLRKRDFISASATNAPLRLNRQMIWSKGLWQKFAEGELRPHAFWAGDMNHGRRVGEFADALAAAAARRAKCVTVADDEDFRDASLACERHCCDRARFGAGRLRISCVFDVAA